MSKLFYFSPTDENFPHTIQEIGRESLSVIREKTDEELYHQDAAPLPPDLIPVTFHRVVPPGDMVFPYNSEVDIRGYYEIWRTDTNEKVPGDLISYGASDYMTQTSTPGIFKVTGIGSGNFVFTFTGDDSEYSIDEKSIKEPFTAEKDEPIIDIVGGVPSSGVIEMEVGDSFNIITTPSDLDLRIGDVTPEVTRVSGLTITAVGTGTDNIVVEFLGNEFYRPTSIDLYIEVR